MLEAGRSWKPGERVRVYRTARGTGRIIDDDAEDPRDYDIEHYVRILREQYATRFSRALAPDDFAAVFADPDQLALFTPALADMHPVLTPIDP